MTGLRVASWNLHCRSGDAAGRLGSVLAAHGGADLVLLQEASVSGLPRFGEAAGLDWWVHVRGEWFDLLRVRGRAGGPNPAGGRYPNARGVAIAGRGDRLRGAAPFPDVPLPEKVMAGWLDLDGQRVTVLSYHAPAGVSHHELKPRQAVRIAEWLASLDGPVIMGGDFNTPSVDPPDFERVHTHWHTGEPHLNGESGDDLLVGPTPVHGLRDALRLYLAARPAELAAIAAERPDGPLAVSHGTGRNAEYLWRYDAIWLTAHFEVTQVEYRYDEAIEAGTDHGLVLVDAELKESEG